MIPPGEAPPRPREGAALVKTALGAARFRLTGHRAPLAVTLILTRRCDASCLGCGLPQQPKPELSTTEVHALLDELAQLGTTRLRITGGEPLLRDDLGSILTRAHQHGMRTVLDTNGHRLPARLPELGEVGRIMVALHGPEAVHDDLAEIGAFAKVTDGIRAARGAGRRVGAVTLLARQTLQTLPWVLEHAEREGVEMVVQLPQIGGALGSRSARRLVAPDAELRQALRWLLEARVAGRPVAMSEKTLRFLLTWPDYTRFAADTLHEDLRCMAGQVSALVDADGAVYGCLPRTGTSGAPTIRDSSFAAAFNALRDPSCRSCTDTACTEANFLYNFNTPVVIEAARAGARAMFGGAR